MQRTTKGLFARGNPGGPGRPATPQVVLDIRDVLRNRLEDNPREFIAKIEHQLAAAIRDVERIKSAYKRVAMRLKLVERFESLILLARPNGGPGRPPGGAQLSGAPDDAARDPLGLTALLRDVREMSQEQFRRLMDLRHGGNGNVPLAFGPAPEPAGKADRDGGEADDGDR